MYVVNMLWILNDVVEYGSDWKTQDMLLGHGFWNFFATGKRYEVIMLL